MHFTIRQMTSGWRRHALAAVALALFLTFLGPFRSGEVMTAGPRAVYWLALVATGYVLALAAFRLVGNWPNGALGRAFLVSVIASVPQMFIVSWALVQVRPGRVIDAADLPMLFVSVLSIELVIVAIQKGLSPRPAATVAIAESAAAQSRGRIPLALRRDLIALEAEDHYVRVHHAAGSTLILHRFGDALGELDPASGLQVHRGWWVASGAVTGTFLRGGKRWLKLSNGLQVPVSRTYLRSVSEQGWPRVADPT